MTLITNYSVIEHRFQDALDVPIKMMQLWRIFKVSFFFSEKGEHLKASAGFDSFF